jgi:molecular chaperone HscA
VTQRVEVKPSYGLDDEAVERMLIEALDHGEEDFEKRRLVDARVESERVLLATEKALAADADLLEPAERGEVDVALDALKKALVGSSAAAIQSALDTLDHATHGWAGRRMNRAVQAAIEGRALTDIEQRVERAQGVEAHLAQHAAGKGL